MSLALNVQASAHILASRGGKVRHPSRSRTLRGLRDGVFGSAEAAPVEAQNADDMLVSLSGMLGPDAGKPGEKPELQIANSLAALFFFHEHGNTATSVRIPHACGEANSVPHVS